MSSIDLLLPLLIAVPIITATLPIALGLRYDRTGWSVAALTTTGLLAGALALASVVYTDGPVSHTLGGYPIEYGIQLVADEFSTLITLLVTTVATGVLAYTRAAAARAGTRSTPRTCCWSPACSASR